uniref:putative calmodulin-like protein 6 n=1 Tax=Ciona intestinalis TaxID=7719 RepID=UPI0002B8DEE1|nr:putative calmodulin-like protein 6 [Ciona intestinalis]|eukprot:XP_004226613.1 putative calmodulin-like protein 6 [Ciona intestinalis]
MYTLRSRRTEIFSDNKFALESKAGVQVALKTEATSPEKIENEKIPPEESKAMFKLFDKNDNGFLTAEDIMRVMHSLGQHITKIEVFDILNLLGVNEPVSLQDFDRIISHELSPSQVFNNEAKTAFQLFSSNGDIITKSDLARLLIKLGKVPTNDDLIDMMHEGDVDGDGQISYNDFLSVLCS